ncbi:hypothetical protein MELB17_04457 [Marinobacter sp. ELB17]|nr:hypothetical protein MELB17_04457 [Marinobacter sp. ELB17]
MSVEMVGVAVAMTVAVRLIVIAHKKEALSVVGKPIDVR